MFTQSYLSPSIVIMISLINIESRSFRRWKDYLRPPTKPLFPSSLSPFCFCEEVVSLPTDTLRIIRTASSLAWRFVDCCFFLPFLAISSPPFSRFPRRSLHSVVARVSYNIARKTGDRRWDGKGDGKSGDGRSCEDREAAKWKGEDIK